MSATSLTLIVICSVAVLVSFVIHSFGLVSVPFAALVVAGTSSDALIRRARHAEEAESPAAQTPAG